MNFRDIELTQKRWPVLSRGPSSKRWPRCEPQRAQVISVRVMPRLVSVVLTIFEGSTASQKLGEAMYKHQQEAQNAPPGGGEDAAAGEKKEDVVDAEFTEVNDDKNNKKPN